MGIQPRHTYPRAFADGSKYPKQPPANTEKVIEMAVKLSWPFQTSDRADVEVLVCTGAFPRERMKNDIDHGAWFECVVDIDYEQSHSFSIESLQGLRSKVLDLTGFRLESMSFEAQHLNTALRPKVIARLVFADWPNMVFHK